MAFVRSIPKASSRRRCFCFLLPLILLTAAWMQAQNPPGPFPARMFSLIVNRLSSYPLKVPYGGFRGWDAGGAQWPDLEQCQASTGSPNDPCFDWKNLDTELADLKSAGVAEVMYTMSRSPGWAVNLTSDPLHAGGTKCAYYGTAGLTTGAGAPGQCLPPSDLNADGSGPNLIWKNWVRAIATRVNDPTYLQTHAHIYLWEPWNEWWRDPVVTSYNGQPSFAGTYAQMLRLMEDLRCIVTGTGTIHNYPSQGASVACSETAIDPNALITTPSGGLATIRIQQNLLYCNQSPANDMPGGNATSCNWGNGENWGSQAADVVNFHAGIHTAQPETSIQTWIAIRAALSTTDAAKPMMCGECSWGPVTSTSGMWSNPEDQVGYIPRFMASLWSAGVMYEEWYSYETDDGQLYNPNSTSLILPTANGWTSSYNWLVNATPVNDPFCSAQGTVWQCDFTKPNYTYRMVWDSQYGEGGTTAPTSCSTASNPIICGNTSYSVPSEYNLDWTDLNGIQHAYASTVIIGANPILLRGQVAAPVTPQFSLAILPSSKTAAPGQQVAYALNLAANTTTQVALTCAVSPATATCTVSPTPVTVTTSGSATASLVVTTPTTSAAALFHQLRIVLASIVMPFFVAGVVTLPRKRRAWELVACLLLGILLVSCGGRNSSGSSSSGSSFATTYTITVTGTSSANEVSQTATLVVQ